MIIPIWFIGVMLLWMVNMLLFNVKGYWTVSRYIAWCVVWSIAVAGYFLWGKI